MSDSYTTMENGHTVPEGGTISDLGSVINSSMELINGPYQAHPGEHLLDSILDNQAGLCVNVKEVHERSLREQLLVSNMRKNISSLPQSAFIDSVIRSA